MNDASQNDQAQPQTQELPVRPLSRLAEIVVKTFEKDKIDTNDRKISVNPVVAKFAEWYEKLRNAMEIRDEEVILRSSIERILKRKLLLGGNAQTTAEPLVRELIWARYLPDNQVPESMVKRVEEKIDLYLQLRFKVMKKHHLSEATMNQWTYHLLSSDLVNLLNPSIEKETMNNFMFQVLRNEITLEDATEETRNAQVYIAVRRAFAKDDLAFLRFNLFTLYFGKLTKESLDSIVDNFLKGYLEIVKELSFKGKERIFVYVRSSCCCVFHTRRYSTCTKILSEDAVRRSNAFQANCFASLRSEVPGDWRESENSYYSQRYFHSLYKACVCLRDRRNIRTVCFRKHSVGDAGYQYRHTASDYACRQFFHPYS